MADPDALPEPDRAPGAPHPRETPRLIGHDAAARAFLETYNSGRLHHAWLITGPRGVGKATLAWAIARFLLATPPAPAGGAGDGLFGDAVPPAAPETLDIPPDHPVARRVAALSDQGLFLLRRGPNDKGDRLSAEIRVAEVRKLKSFFALSSAEGGRRVVIVDAADEMNVNAANALLKLLEEPPENATLLLVAHQPSALLPTIRSRCRELRLTPLGPEDMAAALAQAGTDPGPDAPALAELGGGSVGAALRLIHLDGLALYGELLALMQSLPRLDRPRAIKLADSLAGRGAEERRDLAYDLLDRMLARLARTGATGHPPAVEAAPGEAECFARLAPDARAARRWAELSQEVGARLRHGVAVNLDPANLTLDALFRLQAAAPA
ncbi:DNA polymerase III subunit delta' [Aquicoccus sp. SCR17]|nr:DNA polymerase III subunit delta' [Carideicomes alvinocaridis]